MLFGYSIGFLTISSSFVFWKVMLFRYLSTAGFCCVCVGGCRCECVSMCSSLCMVYMFVCVHVYGCTCEHVYMKASDQPWVSSFAAIHLVFLFPFSRVCVCVFMHVYACLHLCRYTWVYVYICTCVWGPKVDVRNHDYYFPIIH